MMRDPLTAPADACSSDADRAGPDASARLPEWLVHLFALVIRFILERRLAAGSHHSALTSWLHDRPDLPLASAQALAASIRGAFGNAIAWMCLRRGIGPGHPDWPELSRYIVMFGGSLAGFRPGLPAFGLLWWENPGVIPGMTGEIRPTPAAATALALLLSRQAAAGAPPAALLNPAATTNPAAKHILRFAAGAALPLAFLRQFFARTATGPPIGPPVIRAQQFSYA